MPVGVLSKLSSEVSLLSPEASVSALAKNKVDELLTEATAKEELVKIIFVDITSDLVQKIIIIAFGKNIYAKSKSARN